MVMDHTIDVDDLGWFNRCRRAWDLGAASRRNLVASAPPHPTQQEALAAALAAGLAAFFYPAMAAWNRSLVRPIALQAFAKELRAREAASTPAAEEGSRILDRYFDWVPHSGPLTPVRVAEEIVVVVPDPAHPDEGLRARDGGAIKLRGTLDLVEADDHNRLWLHLHRFVDGPWADPDLLVLDERAAALCWMAQSHYVTAVAGVLVDEVQTRSPQPGLPPGPARRGVSSVEDPAGWFRRTRLRKTPAELRLSRQRVAAQAVEMTASALAVYPNPSPEHCRTCAFRQPCLAMSAGTNAEALLAAAFQPHVAPSIPLPQRTGSCGPQVVHGWQTRGPGPSTLRG